MAGSPGQGFRLLAICMPLAKFRAWASEGELTKFSQYMTIFCDGSMSQKFLMSKSRGANEMHRPLHLAAGAHVRYQSVTALLGLLRRQGANLSPETQILLIFCEIYKKSVLEGYVTARSLYVQ
jgi:hypothetical protein